MRARWSGTDRRWARAWRSRAWWQLSRRSVARWRRPAAGRRRGGGRRLYQVNDLGSRTHSLRPAILGVPESGQGALHDGSNAGQDAGIELLHHVPCAGCARRSHKSDARSHADAGSAGQGAPAPLHHGRRRLVGGEHVGDIDGSGGHCRGHTHPKSKKTGVPQPSLEMQMSIHAQNTCNGLLNGCRVCCLLRGAKLISCETRKSDNKVDRWRVHLNGARCGAAPAHGEHHVERAVVVKLPMPCIGQIHRNVAAREGTHVAQGLLAPR